MLKAVRIRIYPNKNQADALARAFGCARWIWNWSLNKTREQYQFFASSKTCSSCGTKADSMPLQIRNWTCICGTEHDRDINAAKNIKSEAQRLIAATEKEAEKLITTAGLAVAACGGTFCAIESGTAYSPAVGISALKGGEEVKRISRVLYQESSSYLTNGLLLFLLQL